MIFLNRVIFFKWEKFALMIEVLFMLSPLRLLLVL